MSSASHTHAPLPPFSSLVIHTPPFSSCHTGENLFRSDMGIERAYLGSMLDHTGPMGQAEKYQSYIFGSHRTYSGVNGSSGSNRVIFSAWYVAREGEGEGR